MCVHDLRTTISNEKTFGTFSSNSEAFASELLENIPNALHV